MDDDAVAAAAAAGGLSEEQQDELLALHAMFEDDLEILADGTLQVRVVPDVDAHDDYSPWASPASPLPTMLLHVTFEPGYPAERPPSYRLHAVALEAGEAAFVREQLLGLFEPGEPVVYEWVLWLKENAAQLPSLQREARSIESAVAAVRAHEQQEKEQQAERDAAAAAAAQHVPPRAGGDAVGRQQTGEKAEEEQQQEENPGWASIYHGPTFTDRKSVFQAHLSAVRSAADVRRVMQTLLQDRKVQRATHNMSAYRIYDEARSVWVQDNDDDGESAAGRRMAHLLTMMDVRNVLVVVSRWYGGIHLGPDRFKIINNVTRQALLECGFAGAGKATSAGGDESAAAGGGKRGGGSGAKRGKKKGH